MRIIKSATIRGGDEEFVFSCFDKIIKPLFPMLKYDVIKIEIADKTDSLVDNNTAIILVDKNAFFVKSRDEKYVTVLLAKNLLLLTLQEEAPQALKDLIVFRKIIALGFSDMLSYYFYVSLHNKEHKSIENFIDASLSWLSYAQKDVYYHDMFHGMMKNMEFPESYWKKCTPLFNLMKKDLLFSDNLLRSTRLYKKVVS